MSRLTGVRTRFGFLANPLLALAVATSIGGSPASAQRPAPPTPVKPAPTPPPGSTAAPATVVFGVKRLGVATPVTGSQPSIGVIELNGPAPPGGVTIQLSSSNPAIVAVRASVVVPAGMTGENFEVTTFAVSLPTEVTMTAVPKGGTVASSATVTVVPPALGKLDCGSSTITAGTTATCTVSLNGSVAAGPAAIEPVVSLTSSNPSLGAVPAQVNVKQGESIASFALKAKPIAQSAPLVISAAYGGVIKSLPLTLVPAPLQALFVQTVTTHDWGEPISVRIVLTAPAPTGGLVVQLTSDRPQVVQLPQAVRIPAGEVREFVEVPTRFAAPGTAVTIQASVPQAGQALTASLWLWGSDLDSFTFYPLSAINGVPFGGTTVTATVYLRRPAPAGGAAVSLKYAGGTDISGPPSVTVASGETKKMFEVKVLPCSVNPPCTVTITGTYGATKMATLTVRP